MSKFELPNNVSYKDVDVLKQFITETGKIIPARVSGVSASNQRKVTKYIKIARFLALLPYTCLLYTSPSPRDVEESRMPSSA